MARFHSNSWAIFVWSLHILIFFLDLEHGGQKDLIAGGGRLKSQPLGADFAETVP